MQNETLIELLKKFKNTHPLIVKRTLYNTKSLGESIYILENLPKYPFTWDNKKRKWINKNASID